MTVKWNHTSDPKVRPGIKRGWVYLFWDGSLLTTFRPPEPAMYQLDFRVSGSLPPPLGYAVAVDNQPIDKGTIPLAKEGDVWHTFQHVPLSSDAPATIAFAYTTNKTPHPAGFADGDRNMWVDKLTITPIPTVLVTTRGDAPSQNLFDAIRGLKPGN